MASTMLAIGLFFAVSCSHFQSSSQEESPESTLESYTQQLEEVNADLESNPDDPALQLQKADLLVAIAFETTRPGDRRPFYQNLRDLSDQHRFTDGPSQSDFDRLTTKAWTAEQGDGVRLLQQSEPENHPQLDQIVAHLENAITVNPDSLSSYNLLANTHYRNGKLNKAISVLEDADQITEESSKELREKLAYLYLESGSIDRSITLYEELAEMPSVSAHIRHGLANAYMLNRQHTDAIRVLTRLTHDFPSRYEYQEALATERYFRLLEEIDGIVSRQELTDEDLSLVISTAEEIDGLFATLKENVPSSEETLLRSGAFYKNTAQRLTEISSLGSEDQTGELQVTREDLLVKALPIWEKLTENHSENMDYVRNLYIVYTELEMDEEAESLQRSFNL